MTDPIGDENGSDRGGSGWPVRGAVGLILTTAAVVVALVAATPRSAPTLSTTPGEQSTPTAARTDATTPASGSPAVPPPGVVFRDVSPRPGSEEGMIAITRRICGRGDTWVAQANANGIKPPVWLVLDSDKLTIDCSLPAVAPPPVPSASPPASRTQPAPVTHVTAGSGWVYPVPRGTCVTSHYGAPRDGGARSHQGTDLGASYGTPIHAMAAGSVFVAGWVSNNAGNGVEIRHAGGIVTKYFHLSRLAVSRDQSVGAGQVIGYVGATGDAKGAHLHLEVWVGGSAVNPETWLPAHVGLRLGC